MTAIIKVIRGPLLFSGATFFAGDVVPTELWGKLPLRNQTALLNTRIVRQSFLQPSAQVVYGEITLPHAISETEVDNIVYKAGQVIAKHHWESLTLRLQKALLNLKKVTLVEAEVEAENNEATALRTEPQAKVVPSVKANLSFKEFNASRRRGK